MFEDGVFFRIFDTKFIFIIPLQRFKSPFQNFDLLLLQLSFFQPQFHKDNFISISKSLLTTNQTFTHISQLQLLLTKVSNHLLPPVLRIFNDFES